MVLQVTPHLPSTASSTNQYAFRRELLLKCLYFVEMRSQFSWYIITPYIL